VLKATGRDINTLSPVLRAAWDGRPLALLTRTAPARASNAHIAVVGHITAAELAHHTNAVEAANGFLNRFVFIACRRHRLLPEGGDPDPLAGTGIEARLGRHLTAARRAGQVRLDLAARLEWCDAYTRLSEADDGLVGSLCARAEAHVLRLAMLYALIDGDTIITTAHLRAGLALWDYAARSVAWATRTATTDPVAEQIHTALTASPDGLTRTQLRDLFARNLPGNRIDTALIALGRTGRAHRHRLTTTGRPAEIWSAAHPDVSHPTEPGSRPARQGRPAGTEAKRRALTPAGQKERTIDLARQLCWRAYPRPPPYPATTFGRSVVKPPPCSPTTTLPSPSSVSDNRNLRRQKARACEHAVRGSMREKRPSTGELRVDLGTDLDPGKR